MRISGAHVNRGRSLPPLSITAPSAAPMTNSATGGTSHMTNKTRIRVARIAAGAVIAAGASFTAAGIASADECDLVVICAGTPSPDPTPTATDPTGVPTQPDPDPTTADPEPSLPDPEPTTALPEPSEPEEPSTEPSEPTDEDPTDTPSDDPSDETGTGSDGGNSNTDPDGGSNTSVQEEGSSALTDTGSETAAQGSGDELAETGAAETTFLIIGAATMIAGGVAFRVLPRLVGGRGGAAA